MEIMDQLQDKAGELEEQAWRAMGATRDEASEHAQQDPEQDEDEQEDEEDDEDEEYSSPGSPGGPPGRPDFPDWRAVKSAWACSTASPAIYGSRNFAQVRWLMGCEGR
ncbi:hypothetical protein [Streptomyces luteireticuli]|uniref:hypothetical protein n=1 Tax=Streptomyces luteireticuli TaxID=173858 RepID=UPI0035586BA6